MARKRKLDTHVIEVKSEDEQPSSESPDGEEEISEEEEEENEHEDADEDEEEEEADEDEEEDVDEDELEGDEDEAEDFSSKESIRKLLEPFGKDQLIEMIQEAVLKNPSLLSRVVKTAEADPVHRNIFVHGLGWDVTSETLAAAFSPFGKMDECKVVTDHATGRCKGYGFILFSSLSAARRATKEPLKKIGGRITHCQLAYLGHTSGAGQIPSEVTGRKLYVGNLGSNVNPERLLAFFAKFGEIEQGPLGYDPATGKLRGYALFIYKTVEGLNKALEEPTKYFEGCELHCRKAFEGSNKINNTQIAPAVASETVLTGRQANDFALSYAPAAALIGQKLTPAPTTVIGPSVGVGLLNPVAGLSPALSVGGAGFPQQPYTVGGAGIPPQSYAIGPVGSANRASGLGVNSISPSVIGNYGSLAALQGIGAYQNSASSAAMRPQSGISSLGASGLAPFYGH
ncbi:UBP1-associated protein 2A-like [Phalaenopsis equestris]|uniref:UBP1-associated protein 2A-like n=1 Tax=Phalaenopsis equestris TaxID=78828 RepID=UPI0009E4499E|nr:UBP1-associated protein 2A-like [Phalaenopsis equestris]